MRKSILCSMLAAFAVSFPLLAEDLLSFGAGRVFIPKRLQEQLRLAGCEVKLIDSTNLAEFGGASTKRNPNDPNEPEPPKQDGITPEFARLSNYKAVMFHGFAPTLLRKMLTPERIAALRTYVKNGGSLILNRYAPAALGDLLPVKFSGSITTPRGGVTMNRPRHVKFDFLPEKWEKLAAFRPCTAVNGAEVLSEIFSADGKVIAVGMAKMNYGKGTVWFYNADWQRSKSLKQFWSWAYGKAFMTALVSAATGKELNIKNSIAAIPVPPPRKEFSSLALNITEPVNKLADKIPAVKDKNGFKFANGVRLVVRKDGIVEIMFPKAGKEKIKLNPPTIQLAGEPERMVGYEAFIDNSKLKKYRIKWTMTGAALKNGAVEVSYKGDEGSLIRWIFRGGDLTLDGRKFSGFADNVIVDRMPILLNSLAFNATFPESSIRRTAVYSRPRGYLAGKMDAQNGLKNIGTWQMFCGGQPFAYNQTNAGLLIEFPATPVPCYLSQTAFAKAKGSNRTLRMVLGRRKSPCEIPAMWHFFSAGKERGNNDFMATWQFVRLNLKSQFGIKTFPMKTCATLYLHGTPMADVEKAMAAAQKYNFKSMYFMFGQCKLVHVASDRAKGYYDLAKKYGLATHPWTPGYADSFYEPIYRENKDWFLKQRNGKTHAYGGRLPVVDFNNPDFRKWYFDLMDKAIANGMNEIYVDMMGQSSSNVNYAGDSAEPNLKGVIKVFKFWSDRNIAFAVEGMNPLGRDQALFGNNKDADVSGREFAYVGGSPLTSGDRPAINFEYFRLLMHNATTNIHVDGVAQNFDRFPGESAAFERIGRVNKLFNRAFAEIPAPWVREVPCGTVWMGEKTGAIFFWDPVKDLKLQLPAGWQIVPGTKLKNIPAESAVFIEKKR